MSVTQHWNDLDSPTRELQTVTVRVVKASGAVALRVNHHSELYGSEAILNGERVDHTGKEFVSGTSFFMDYDDYYCCNYSASAYNLADGVFCITPCTQDFSATYSVYFPYLMLGAEVLTCEEIQLDTQNGMTLKGVSGDFELYVSPVRGGSLSFGYRDDYFFKGHLEEAADLTLTWNNEEESFAVKSAAEISGFKVGVSVLNDPDPAIADTAKSEYHITFELVDPAFDLRKAIIE